MQQVVICALPLQWHGFLYFGWCILGGGGGGQGLESALVAIAPIATPATTPPITEPALEHFAWVGADEMKRNPKIINKAAIFFILLNPLTPTLI